MRHRGLGVFGLLALSACAPLAGTGQGSDAEDDATAGELAAYVAHGFDGRSETLYFLRNRSGRERRLIFDVAPDLDPGTRIRVYGTDTSEGLRVRTFDRLGTAGGGVDETRVL